MTLHFEHIEAAIDRAAQACPAIEADDAGTCWRPLEALLGPALIGQFMYMGETEAPDGTAITLFKHGANRHYLNLSADLRTWRYVAGRTLTEEGSYTPQPLAAALADVFHQAEELGARPNVPYDDTFRATRDAALAAAGYRTVTAVPGHGVKLPTAGETSGELFGLSRRGRQPTTSPISLDSRS